MNESTFPYRPLPPQAQEIKIIQVLALDEGPQKISQVQCRLKHVNLDDKPEYRALSYVWGDPLATRKITLDDHQVSVTANLETVLRQLARNLYKEGDTHLDLWVDAICIDQANTLEKTQQVSLMDQIYNKAAQTVFCLGKASHDSEVAIECLQWLSAQREQNFRRVLSWTQAGFDPEASSTSDVGSIQCSLDNMLTVLCSDNMRRLRALGEFFDRQWFRRVWILQEAALSTNGVGMIGDGTFDGRHLEVGFNMLCGLRDYLRIATTGQRSSVADFLTKKLGRATAVVFSRGALHLRQLMYLLANPDAPLEASDERDYIFALLGLATDAEELGIRSDYSKTWSEIRVDVAKACLKHYSNGMEVLFFCKPDCRASTSAVTGNSDDDESAVGAVPSWAPNWSPRHLPRPLSIRSRFSYVRGGWQRNAYNACGDTVSSISDECFLPNGVLVLSAIRVDDIKKIGPQLAHRSDDDGATTSTIDSFADWLVGMKTLLLPDVNAAYPTNETAAEALWRTPIADRGLVHNYEMGRAGPLQQKGYADILSTDTHNENSAAMPCATPTLRAIRCVDASPSPRRAE